MSTLVILPDEAQWRSRMVRYYAGDWNSVQSVIPEFDLLPFAKLGVRAAFGARWKVSYGGAKPLTAIGRLVILKVVEDWEG
jgi:hypothetical protein